MGLFFYPRGGSSQVAGTCREHSSATGGTSRSAAARSASAGARSNAATAFDGIDIVPAAYDDAVARWERGDDPMDAPFPMHPSYEARPAVPDRAFPWVSPTQGGRMTAAWARLIAGSERDAALAAAAPAPPDAAARRRRARCCRDVPVLTHLHGTELKMLDAIARDAPDVGRARTPAGGPPGAKAAALRATATITISPYERDEAVRLLGLDPEHRPLPAERRRHRAVRAAPTERRQAPRAVARVARARPAGMGRGVRPRRQRALHRGAGARRVLRSRDRRAPSGAAVRRALPRLQAPAPADPRVRPRAGADGDPRAARRLGRRAR